MFDIGASELLLIVIVAIVVIGPKDLPLALRTAGAGSARCAASPAISAPGIETMIREAELEEMEKKWREQNAEIMRRASGAGRAGRRRTPAPAALPAHPPSRAAERRRPPPRPRPSRTPLELPPCAGAMALQDQGHRRDPGAAARSPDRAAHPAAALLVALAVAFAVCLYFADDIFGFLVRPLTAAFPPGEGRLIYTKLYEAFFVEMKVALFAAFFVSFPIIANQLWAFVAPGLYAQGEEGLPAVPARHAGAVLARRGAGLLRGHADGVPLVPRLRGRARRAEAGGAAGDGRLPQPGDAVHPGLRDQLPAAGAAAAAQPRRASSAASSWPARGAM